MEQTPLQEQVHTDSPLSASESPPAKASTTLRNVISLSAALLAGSFFMPWVSVFNSNISGLGIQLHFQSYNLVWLLPMSALFVLTLNIVGVPTGPIRRIVGLIPFGILVYSLNKFNSHLFQIISWGGWFALAAGIVLIVTPSPKPQPYA